jgi:hypothetical protein
MSMLQMGLPAAFSNRWSPVGAIVCVAVAANFYFGIYGKIKNYLTEPKAAPICYGNEHAPGTLTIPGLGLRDSQGRSVDQRHEFHPDDINAALKACTPQSCPSAAWKQFSSAMFWYIAPRTQHTSNLYRAYGDDGLVRARQIYSEPIDVMVEKGLRERYAAGVFRLNDFRQNQAAIAIIVLKGSTALRPCRKGEAGEGG